MLLALNVSTGCNVTYEIYAVNDKFHLLNGFLWINLDAWQTFPCPPAPTQQVQQGSQGQAGGQDYHPGHHRGWDNHPCYLKGIKHTQQFPLTKSYNKRQCRVLWWYQLLPLVSTLPPTRQPFRHFRPDYTVPDSQCVLYGSGYKNCSIENQKIFITAFMTQQTFQEQVRGAHIGD